MKITHYQTLAPPSESPNLKSKVTSLSFTPDHKYLAVSFAYDCISIFDDNGDQVDSFHTKPNDGGSTDYIINSIEFCPLSSNEPLKLAITQSNSVVYVYKWNHNQSKQGESTTTWDTKKSICNTFHESSSASCLLWPETKKKQIIFGLSEGKIMIGHLRTNKSEMLYQAEGSVLGLACDTDAKQMLSTHADGSVYRFQFSTSSSSASCQKIIHHSCMPYILSWQPGSAGSICVGGDDGKLTFYDINGNETASFSCTSGNDSSMNSPDPFHQFTVAAFNPTGNLVAVGAYNCVYIYSWNSDRNQWEENERHDVENIYIITSLIWKPDGSSFVLGTAFGLVDTFDVSYRHYILKNQFDIIFVSPNQVLIRDKENIHTSPTLLKCGFDERITKIRLFKEPDTNDYRYVVARTDRHILVHDMSHNGYNSKIQWNFCAGSNKETFIFDFSDAFIIIYDGEVFVVENGSNSPLGSVRTEFTSSHVISLAITKQESNNNLAPMKVLAYLVDDETICIKNLVSSIPLTISHKSAIDFLVLNSRGKLLLFRDKESQLYLFDTESQSRTSLLTKCSYAQWVPQSDVIVAQQNNLMWIWYNTNAIDQPTVRKIKGTIIRIERHPEKNRTEVIVEDETYSLSESIISFHCALKANNFIQCIDILNSLSSSEQSLSMWEQLYDAAVDNNSISVAIRCSAALGNMSLERYLQKIMKASHSMNGKNNWQLSVKMSQLNKDFMKAEKLYLSHGESREAFRMYKNISMSSDAFRLAEKSDNPLVIEEKDRYYQELINCKEDTKVAHLNEAEGNYIQAITTYMNAGCPEKAALVIFDNDILHPTRLLESVASALSSVGLDCSAGKIYEKLGLKQKALESYLQGNAYREAVNISRIIAPTQVMSLEEQWGDYLLGLGQNADAIEHFVEANAPEKAFKSAISGKLWNKADILSQDPSSHEKFANIFKSLTKHAILTENENVEKYLLKGRNYRELMDFYIEAKQFEKATSIAKEFLSKDDIHYVNDQEGKEAEALGNWQAAEKLYLQADDVDKVVTMYRENGMLEDLTRVVSKYCPSRMKETNEFVLNQMEAHGNFLGAEKILRANGDLSLIVSLYRRHHMHEEVVRVEKMMDKDKTFDNGERNEQKESSAQDKSSGSQIGLSPHQQTIISGDQNIENMKQLKKNGHVSSAAFNNNVSDIDASDNTSMRLVELLQTGSCSNFVETVNILTHKGPLPDCISHFELYRLIVCGILSFTQTEEESVDYLSLLCDLKHVMNAAYSNAKEKAECHIRNAMDHLRLAVHFCVVMHATQEYDQMKHITCQSSISLLRYSTIVLENGDSFTIVPTDKAFFNAGVHCKECDHDHLSLILLKRYLDIINIMEDNDDITSIDNHFASTVLPFDSNLPMTHFVSDLDRREEVRDFVLSACIDSTSLPAPNNDSSATIYDGLYRYEFPTCFVTGYPIRDEATMITILGGKTVNKEDYDAFVKNVKRCPWTGEPIN